MNPIWFARLPAVPLSMNVEVDAWYFGFSRFVGYIVVFGRALLVNLLSSLLCRYFLKAPFFHKYRGRFEQPLLQRRSKVATFGFRCFASVSWEPSKTQ